MASSTIGSRHRTHEDLKWFLGQCRPRRLRTMRQFAEEEIVIPSGPFSGRRFRCARQPYSGLWFDEVDSGRWSRCVATGPTQSGKTLTCFVIPLLYHLFEMSETVILGLPDMDMAGDKWREDILPVIEQSKFRELLPSAGGGSRGGRVESLQFANGATLKFMSGGGSDKSRAGFTSRVVVITETDGMDQASGNSRESDKITQLEARTRAYGRRKRIYMECTVSTEKGRTWQEYLTGTKSRIVLPCPHCKTWVSPQREHLIGWQSAENREQARQMAQFACPACGVVWSDAQREEANASCRLLHSDQTISADGLVEGHLPQTDTLGFRWSAVNNLFLTAGEVGADEWRAAHAADEENAEREMRQFVWAIPTKPSRLKQISLEINDLAMRMIPLERGIVPNTATVLTAALDLGKYLAHWVAVAWSASATGHIVDYGRIEVPSDDLGVENAVLNTMRSFRERMGNGFVKAGSSQKVQPNMLLIDSGWQAPVVYAFCRESGQGFYPAIGRGAAQVAHEVSYQRTTQDGSVTKFGGEGYQVDALPIDKVYLFVNNADHWKSWVHQRLSTPMGQPGAMTLFKATPQDHTVMAKHLTAEAKTEEFVAGKGTVVKWERIRKDNHYFDALYNACVAGHGMGVRLVEEPPPTPKEKRSYFEEQRNKKNHLSYDEIRERMYGSNTWATDYHRW